MRQNTNADTIYVGDFKGMATSGGTYAATPEYLQLMTNATVTKDGTIKPRNGSNVLLGTTVAETVYTEVFKFSFAGQNWLLQRFGTDFNVNLLQSLGQEEIYNTSNLAFKSNVLRPQSASEPATYAVKTEGNYCHVLVATKSTQLIAITLCRKDIRVTSVSATQAIGNYSQWYTTSMSVSNTKVLINNRFDQPGSTLTGVSSASQVATLTWNTRPSAIAVGDKVTVISCFWTRFCDANYYQGSQLYDNGLRRNTVPLDVNVPIPDTIKGNPIYNEPIQDLSIESVVAYADTVVNASKLTKVTNQQPTTETSWDFSDGSFRAVANQRTNRTQNFAAFGSLVNGNINTRINFARLRAVLVTGFDIVNEFDLNFYVDKTSRIPVFFNQAGNVIPSGLVKYFSFTANASNAPGVPLDSVVEIVYSANGQAGSGASTQVVDISNDVDRHAIGDGWMVPLYGYSLVASSASVRYPNIVRFVGNRMLLSGNGNTILISSNDWNYRGYTFTNCQVSSLDFGENSAYLLRVDQTGADVLAIESSNGVVVVFNETGVFRVSGRERNAPPNAITASVSKISNQTIRNSNQCISINNNVFFTNTKGLFSVGYSDEKNDGVVTEVSLPVSNWFTNVPTNISYSFVMDSLLIATESQNKLIRFDLQSGTWSFTHVTMPYKPLVFATFDGFIINNGTFQLTVAWSKLETVDFNDIDLIPGGWVFNANQVTVTTTPALYPTLVTAPELTGVLSALVVPAYNGQLRAVGGSPVLTEATNAKIPRQIVANAVTKSLYTDKATRGMRLRGISVYLTGVGTVTVVVTGASNGDNIVQTTHTIAIAANGTYTITGAKQKSHNSIPTGDTIVAYLSDLGIASAYNVAFAVGAGVEVIGYALDTSAKTIQKLA